MTRRQRSIHLLAWPALAALLAIGIGAALIARRPLPGPPLDADRIPTQTLDEEESR